MKKIYNAPNITVTEVKTVMMAGSVGMDDTPLKDFTSARSRRSTIDWSDDDDYYDEL